MIGTEFDLLDGVEIDVLDDVAGPLLRRSIGLAGIAPGAGGEVRVAEIPGRSQTYGLSGRRRRGQGGKGSRRKQARRQGGKQQASVKFDHGRELMVHWKQQKWRS